MDLVENFSGLLLEAGCDEAGRGCLAGPVVAAAVILNPEKPIIGLNDSKKLTERRREALRPEIEENVLCFAVGIVSPAEIDEINILQASFLAMHRAVEKLEMLPEFLIIDGNRFKPFGEIPFDCMVKGDGRFQSIAAASILAKTYRDELMLKLDHEFSVYNWKQNKGYPTVQHRKAIALHGTTLHHRMSFTLLPDQLSLF